MTGHKRYQLCNTWHNVLRRCDEVVFEVAGLTEREVDIVLRLEQNLGIRISPDEFTSIVRDRDMGSYGRMSVIQDPAGAVLAIMQPAE